MHNLQANELCFSGIRHSLVETGKRFAASYQAVSRAAKHTPGPVFHAFKEGKI